MPDLNFATSYVLTRPFPPREPYRFFVWQAVGPNEVQAANPTAGGRVDGVTHAAHPSEAGLTGHGWARCPGVCFRVEAGAAISPGQLLATDASGRAVPATGSAVPVAVALGGAPNAGVLVPFVFI